MRTSLTIAGFLAMTLIIGGCTSTRTGPQAAPESQVSTSPRSTSSGSTPTSPRSGTGDCTYRPDPASPAPAGKDVGPPPDSGTVAATVVLQTGTGDIPIALAAAAPCTVRSFAHLASAKFYDGTPCHRLTTNQALKVLQCGDPTGTGTGGPGYTVPDENPTDLPPSPSIPDRSLYARGTVAMANTGAPNSGGSQFFIVYGDSALPPTYAVFGTVSAAGLAVIDAVAAAGLTPVNSAEDGSPLTPVTIQQAVVGS